jgi:hypothetical protein
MLHLYVILSTRQDGLAGLEAKDLFYQSRVRFFAKAQNDNNLASLLKYSFIFFSTADLFI